VKRNAKEIKIWLLRKGLTITGLAEMAGVSRPVLSHTIHGERNNRRALKALVAAGCPKRFLALPEDMKTRREAL